LKFLTPKHILIFLVVLVTSLLFLVSYTTYSEIRRGENAERHATLSGRAYGEIVWRIQSSQRWLAEYAHELEIADALAETPKKHQIFFQFFKQNLKDTLNNNAGPAQLTFEARATAEAIIKAGDNLHNIVMTTDEYSYAIVAPELVKIQHETSKLATKVGTFEYLAITDFNSAFTTSSRRVILINIIVGLIIIAIGSFAFLFYKRSLEAEADANRTRLETVGSLSAGHSHAIASIVTGMRFFVQMLELKVGEQPKIHAAISHLKDGLQQLTVLSGSLTIISRGKPMEEIVCTLDECLKSLLPRHDAGQQISINSKGKSKYLIVPGTSISIILNELTENAIRHSKRGTSDIEIVTDLIKGVLGIQILDRGIGMAPDVEKRALEPFYSTSGESHNGLGLPSCHALVHTLGGTLEIKNRSGGGAIVSILIPSLNTASATT
jgi:signal transduction histidine kinase